MGDVPTRLAPVPITGLTAEERAVLLAALSAFECGKHYGAELESKQTSDGRTRRAELFRAALVASRLTERLLV